jgi:hypothetical protein
MTTTSASKKGRILSLVGRAILAAAAIGALAGCPRGPGGPGSHNSDPAGQETPQKNS